MNLLSRSREEPEINLTSLIDVVLLLLVFFMVSTSFVREAEINIRLPEANAQPVDESDPEVLEIGITSTGGYLLNGRELVNSVAARDYPVVLAATAVFGALVITGNLLADLLYTVADPRLRRPTPQ